MADQRRRALRAVKTRAGTRYVVQVPYGPASTGGWHVYAVMATGPRRKDRPLYLTLYDRAGEPPGGPDGTRAA